ncbi:hypothetical protein ACMFMG_004307 [Clarireedia jacksonii]
MSERTRDTELRAALPLGLRDNPQVSGLGESGDNSSCDGNHTKIQTAQNTSEALASASTHKERGSPLAPEANEEICIEDSLAPDAQRENKRSSKTEVDLKTSVEIPTEIAAPYTVFSKGKVRFIIAMAAFAGSISPLSATIYFPALNVLSRDLHVSSADINLTLTTYMILQGISPTLFCDLADNLGRRPVIIAGFIIYIGACVGLALQESFPLLLFLRCLQSAGTSSTVAISVSIAADVSTQSERGVYMGWVTSGTAVGTAIGPILGGLLSHYLGWQSIFWFLVILVSIYMVPLILSFPETARNVVGNGSTRPQRWNKPLLSLLTDRRHKMAAPEGVTHLQHGSPGVMNSSNSSPTSNSNRIIFPNPLKSIKVIGEKDVALLLFFNGFVYTAFNTIISSTPYLFGRIYQLDDVQIGLCYIPFGVASFLAPLLNGPFLDWNFARVAALSGFKVEHRAAQSMIDFPLEQARVPIALCLAIVGSASLLCYGWTMEVEGPLPAALALQFIIGLTVTGCFQVMNVLIVDYHPANPATATAANNLVRCLMGGAAGAIIIQMIDGMGCGWCFTLVALVLLFLTPILLVLRRWGPGWRKARMTRSACKSGGE